MGWFSPDINTRIVGNREEFYGRCDVCKQEHTGRREKDVKRQFDACEKQQKQEKQAEEKALKEEKERLSAKKRKEALDKKKRELQEKNEREELKAKREREKEAAAMRGKMKRNLVQKRRAAKGRCEWCNQQPCKGTRPQCAKIEAARLESSMNMLDASDPARFDEQMRIAREMGL